MGSQGGDNMQKFFEKADGGGENFIPPPPPLYTPLDEIRTRGSKFKGLKGGADFKP